METFGSGPTITLFLTKLAKTIGKQPTKHGEQMAPPNRNCSLKIVTVVDSFGVPCGLFVHPQLKIMNESIYKFI